MSELDFDDLSDDELDRIFEIVDDEMQSANLVDFLSDITDVSAGDPYLDRISNVLDASSDLDEGQALAMLLELARSARLQAAFLLSRLWIHLKENPEALAQFDEMLREDPYEDFEPDLGDDGDEGLGDGYGKVIPFSNN